ncbi:hypothetical protein RBEAN4_1223 [Rickettsia bellii str. RML An4]|uniref:Uncharacterized protein n=1 Tax=Rickettsia bellii str. RML An4 TaxID=1359193 RepID=A0A0F3QCA9_RICBE|nr:hypothetical protein RBEAN4_1223 [Rickettsia bellii str. RML An4]
MRGIEKRPLRHPVAVLLRRSRVVIASDCKERGNPEKIIKNAIS